MSKLYAELTNLYDQDCISMDSGQPIIDWLNNHKTDIENIEKFYIDNFAMLKQKLKEKEQTILELQEQSIRDDQVQVIENNRINEQMKTVYIFDQAFLRGLIEPFKGKKTDSIESLLVRQDKFVYTVYASLSSAVSSADTKQSSPAIFAVLISVLTILCIFIVGKRNDRYF